MALKPVHHTGMKLGREPSPARPVRVVARDLAAAETLRRHRHDWGQLTYAAEGTLRVHAAHATWIVPPLRAIWIPPCEEHEVVTLERSRLRALWVERSHAPFPGTDCVVIDVSPLLRELIVALQEDEPGARELRLCDLVLDEIGRSATLPFGLPMPREKRLRALCERMLADPAAPLTLEEWAADAGASARTLARRFEQELGMGFAQWRQQMRLAHAAPLIARGMPLAQVAAELGYASQSAFTAMFTRTFGQPPSRFFARSSQPEGGA